jgi:hypothetical protein
MNREKELKDLSTRDERSTRSLKGKKALAWVPGVLLVTVLAVCGVWLLRRTEPQICPISHRKIHPHSEAVMIVKGKESHVCCIRCALTYGRQTGKPVRLVSVNDYVTARKLQPEKAYYVADSKLVLCEVPEPMFIDEKEPFPKVFDRCEPSVFAFAQREDADAFVKQNGGRRATLGELMKEQESKP